MVFLPLVACTSAVDAEQSNGESNVGAEIRGERLHPTGLQPTGGASESPRVDHCIHPNGTDLNELFGVEATLVTSFCTEVRAGAPWVAPTMWLLGHSFEVVPTWFEPAGPTPLDDYRAKLVSVIYVVDAGTSQEKTFEFANGPALWTGEWRGYVAANAATLGSLPPLSTGNHTVDRYQVLSGPQCDGNGVTEWNCAPAGLVTVGRVSFTVVPR
jgi:hypothetical protein